MESWLEDLEKIFEHSGESKICWFKHNGKLYEISIDDYKIIYDILQKSKEDDG